MLAKLTSKNQLTLPKAAVEATGNAEYFEVEAHRDVFDYIERFHNPGMQQRLDAGDQKVLALTQLSVKTG